MKRDYGEIHDQKKYEKEPVKTYLQFKTSTGRSERTVESIEQRITRFQEFLEQEGESFDTATKEDVLKYVKYLGNEYDVDSDRGIDTYLSRVSAFYEHLREVGIVNGNPVQYVLDQLDLDTSSPDRQYVSVEEMGKFLKWLSDPRKRAIALVLIKTAIRRGELINLSLHCVNIDNEHYQRYCQNQEIEFHKKIRDRPDSIFIRADFSSGEEIAGEVRDHGNKRKRKTIIPIDSELKKSLLEWLNIRPETPNGKNHPLFTTARPRDTGYSRMGGSTVNHLLIRNAAREYGLAVEGYDPTDVDIHYFRHFFTTQMSRNRGDHNGSLEPMLKKYIRGDKMDDEILDIYTHDSWGVNVRSEYLRNIYNFGIYET